MNTNCNECQDRCKDPCGCAEPVFSIEAMPDDPTVLRSNVNGKSVWYDFTPVIKTGETATTVTVDSIARTLNHYGERSTQTITAKELGAIFHLADLGDVDANKIDNYGIPVYIKDDTCGEGCVGTSNSWVAENPVKAGAESMTYVMGTDADGKLQTLLPPADANKVRYIAWDAQNRVSYVTPTIVSTPPRNTDNTVTRLYLDESTGAIVAVREAA